MTLPISFGRHGAGPVVHILLSTNRDVCCLFKDTFEYILLFIMKTQESAFQICIEDAISGDPRPSLLTIVSLIICILEPQ